MLHLQCPETSRHDYSRSPHAPAAAQAHLPPLRAGSHTCPPSVSHSARAWVHTFKAQAWVRVQENGRDYQGGSNDEHGTRRRPEPQLWREHAGDDDGSRGGEALPDIVRELDDRSHCESRRASQRSRTQTLAPSPAAQRPCARDRRARDRARDQRMRDGTRPPSATDGARTTRRTAGLCVRRTQQTPDAVDDD